ncbi:MAG: 50S ribosomal protein L35ae [Sulfolobales archaeon]|nr:50S ribosomal protein L35ae [Sulfolobales archaeon]
MCGATESKTLGIVLGYRRGSSRQYVDQVYIKILSTSSSIHSFIGRKVKVVDSYGNTYLGKIVRAHGTGKNGVVIAVFNRNIPGQLAGAEVAIL